jgi:Protein of unknown function (DUF4435)
MFTRTNLGLGNEHLFYGVEFVVYCEGETIEGEASSLDEVFWTRVFQSMGRNARCKSIGSKSHLLQLAQKVASDEVPNIVVTMDRDYDHLLNQIIDHPRVLYTYGYSWESDVVSNFDFDVAISIFATIADAADARIAYQEYFERQSKRLRRAFALDFKYITHAEKLFDRGKPLSIVVFGGSNPPELRVQPLLQKAKEIGKFQAGVLPEADYRQSCGVRQFYGKTVARMIYHWFVHRTKKLQSKRSIPYEAYISLLSKMLDLGDATEPRNAHYAAVVARIG